MRNVKRVIVLSVLVAIVLMQTFIQNPVNNTPLQEYFPSTSANCISNNTYPAMNAQLYANSSYNFTAGVRDDSNPATSWSRNYDAVNLQVDRAGTGYSNTSLTPLGTYNATYSFENDRAGGLADGFSYSFGAGCSAQVLTNHLNHQQVLQLVDAGAGAGQITQTFSAAQTSGTITFWFAASGTLSNVCNLFMLYAGATNLVQLYLDSNVLKSYYAAAGHAIVTVAQNRWYLITIAFNTATDTHSVSVDGVLAIDNQAFANAGGDATKCYLGLTDAASSTTITFDALDYSWAPGYLTSRNAIDLGQLGVYNATQSFEDETMFAVPSGWTDYSGAGCKAVTFPQVATGAYGHRNILCLDDMSNAGAVNVKYATPAMTAGTIEFWYLTTSTAVGNYIFHLYQGDIVTLAINIYNSGTSVIATSTTIATIAVNTWYHFRIQFDCGTDTYNVWVNGMLRGSGLAFSNVINTGNSIHMGAGSAADTGFQMCYDALDLSTDPAYYTERSSYMRLNTTLSFPVTGDFSYRWQAWSSGIDFNQNWVPFSVIDIPAPADNVQLISASSAETNWIFIDPNTFTQTTLYNSSFPYEHWTFSNYGWINVPYATLAGDSWVETPLPDDNFGADPALYTETGAFAYVYLQMPNCAYLTDNGTTDLDLFGLGNDLWGVPSDVDVDIYGTGSFDENIITYNTQPDTGPYLTTYTHPGNLYGDWGSATFNSNYSYVRLNLALGGWITYESKESPFPVYAPHAGYTIGLTAQDNFHVMMQANTTETLTMRSPTLSSLNLFQNDLIIVTFSTTSERQITLNLKNAGNNVKSLALTDTMNHDFSTQVKTFVITDSTTIDQLEFTGLFDDSKHLQITNITIIRPNVFTDIDLAPYSKEMTYLSPANYELAVFEGGYLVMSQSISVVPDTINKFSYSPITGGQRIVSFFNPAGDVLEFNEFRCQIKRTYNNLTITYNLTSPYFYADDGTTFQLNVTDRFGNSIVCWSDFVSTFIDITLTNIYSLKIQNEMRLPTLLQLTRNAITQSEYVMSNEIVEYTLLGGIYALNYTQTELNQSISINLNVTSALIYNISTVYRTVYFSCFSNDGLGVPDAVRLYCNETRKAWGPVELLGNVNVIVRDFVNDTQWVGVINANTISELNIFVNIASIITNNVDNTQGLSVAISKNETLLQNQTLSPQSSLLFRFTNGHYNLNCTWTNGTVESHTIDVLASGTNLSTYAVSLGTNMPDFTALYASQLYAYAAFGDTFPWSANVTDAYAQFYSVVITNQLANDSAVYFQWNGITLRYDVAAMSTYALPLYVPINATYRAWNGETQQFIQDSYVALSMNATNGQVLLVLGQYAPTPDYSWTTILPVVVIFGCVVAFFTVYIVKLKRTPRGEYR